MSEGEGSRHLGQVVRAAPSAVYGYAADPANLPRWASGLARSAVRVEAGRLVVDSPMGEVVVRFVPPNDLGVLDHDVTLPTGATTRNPLRVIDHPDGAEIVFTIRRGHLTDEEFERDAATVRADLLRLARLVEGAVRGRTG